MQVRTPITVRYGETDMMGVVYHANYLIYCEDARCDFLEAMGFTYAQMEAQGCACPVREVNIAYNAPLRYGDSAYVVTEVERMLATRAVYRQRIFREDMDPENDRPLIDAHITVCFVARDTFQPMSFKKAFPDLYKRYRAVALNQ